MALVLSTSIPPETRDLIHARSLLPPPNGPVVVRGDTSDLEHACRYAGIKGLAELLAAIEAINRWPPGFRPSYTDGQGHKWDGPSLPFGYDPMILRAWAKSFAPSIIDPDVTSPRFYDRQTWW